MDGSVIFRWSVIHYNSEQWTTKCLDHSAISWGMSKTQTWRAMLLLRFNLHSIAVFWMIEPCTVDPGKWHETWCSVAACRKQQCSRHGYKCPQWSMPITNAKCDSAAVVHECWAQHAQNQGDLSSQCCRQVNLPILQKNLCVLQVGTPFLNQNFEAYFHSASGVHTSVCSESNTGNASLHRQHRPKRNPSIPEWILTKRGLVTAGHEELCYKINVHSWLLDDLLVFKTCKVCKRAKRRQSFLLGQIASSTPKGNIKIAHIESIESKIESSMPAGGLPAKSATMADHFRGTMHAISTPTLANRIVS